YYKSAYITIFLFFFQAEDGIRDFHVTGVQTCALPISRVVDRVVRYPARVRVKVADPGKRHQRTIRDAEFPSRVSADRASEYQNLEPRFGSPVVHGRRKHLD